MSHTQFEGTLAHVGLRHTDPEGLSRFYERVMGLRREELAAGVIRLGWGTGHHALEIIQGATGVDHIAFEVLGDYRLARTLDRLRAAKVEIVDEQPPGAHPACAVLHDPDGNRIELIRDVDRSGERHADPGRRPIRVQHATFASVDLPRMVAFYEQTLGFRVSDCMGEVFTWLRSDRAHHTLAVVAAPHSGLDHFSFDVGGWEDFKTWCDLLADLGYEVAWGPGRHGPGNNLFIIFEDTAGIRVELSAEMERYWDDRAVTPARHWEPGARTVNLWGPTPAWRTV